MFHYTNSDTRLSVFIQRTLEPSVPTSECPYKIEWNYSGLRILLMSDSTLVSCLRQSARSLVAVFTLAANWSIESCPLSISETICSSCFSCSS